MRSHLRPIAFALAGFAALGLLLAWVGPGVFLEALREASLPLVAAAFLLYAVFFLLRGARWTMILRPITSVRVGRTAGYTAIGWLVNNIVPMRAGEFARAGLLSRRDRVPFFTGLSSIAVERTLDLLGLAVACAVGLLLLPRAIALPAPFILALEVAWILPVVALATLFVMSRKADATRRLFMGIAVRVPFIGAKLPRFVDCVIEGATALFARPRALPAVLGLTLAMTAAQIGLYACLFLAFAPQVDPLILLAGFPFFILSFIIHLTPGNVGTYEAAFILIFTGLGLPLSTVAPVSVLTHVLTVGFVVVLGVAAGVALGASPFDKETQKPALREIEPKNRATRGGRA